MTQSCCGLIECLPKIVPLDAIIEKHYSNSHDLSNVSLGAVATANLMVFTAISFFLSRRVDRDYVVFKFNLCLFRLVFH